jgi:hypothetical protein
MKKCSRCATSNPSAHTFCYRCGETLPEARPPLCASCGAEIPSRDFVYCPRCGVSLEQRGASTALTPVATCVRPSGAYSQAAAVQTGLSTVGTHGSHSDSISPIPENLYGSPRRRSGSGLAVIIAVVCAVVVVLLILTIVPLRTATDNGSASEFDQPSQATSFEGTTIYYANLTFMAQAGVSVALTWATDVSESLCAVAVGGSGHGPGAWFDEGTGVCSSSYNFTSQGGAFYLFVDGPASFTLGGSLTEGSSTTKVPIL